MSFCRGRKPQLLELVGGEWAGPIPEPEDEINVQLERVKEGRDWLAQMLENDLACYMPNDHGEYCASHRCEECEYTKKDG